MKKLTSYFIMLLMCAGLFIPSSAGANDVFKLLACSPNSTDLCGMNTSDKPLYLFILIKAMGCNGSMQTQPEAKYELIPGKDFNETTRDQYPSYFWKLSHYNYYCLQPGEKVLIQNAPCYGRVTYDHIGRAWHLSPEQWDYLRSRVREQNPNCYWAK
jgi:hypothetical protein